MRHFVQQWTIYKGANTNATDEWQYAVHDPQKKKPTPKPSSQEAILKSVYNQWHF